MMNEGMNLSPESEVKPIERAVVLLKPGCTEHLDRLVGYLEEKGLTILDQKTLQFDDAMTTAFYPHAEGAINKRLGEEAGKAEMERFVNYVTSGEAVALLVEGEDALQKVNRLRDKVREWFHLVKPADAIHASGSPEEAEREETVLGLGGTYETE
jgi:nucleoside diphosphate kinase